MRSKLNKSLYYAAVGCHQSTLTMCKYMSRNTMFPHSCRKTFEFLLKTAARVPPGFSRQGTIDAKQNFTDEETSENIGANYTLQPPRPRWPFSTDSCRAAELCLNRAALFQILAEIPKLPKIPTMSGWFRRNCITHGRTLETVCCL